VAALGENQGVTDTNRAFQLPDDPEPVADWHWMITATWTTGDRSETRTLEGVITQYEGDTRQDLVQSAQIAFANRVQRDKFAINLFQLEPNTLASPRE
jgi:hypothetical protein